jgi:hypothetical protein
MSPENFLNLMTIRQTAGYISLGTSVVEQLVALAQRISASEHLRQVAESVYANPYPELKGAVEPSPESVFGDEVEKLYALIALDAVRRLRAVHQQRRIPEALTRASSHPPATYIRRYATMNDGKLGVERWLLGWFQFVASGDLYRLGRMEYSLQSFDGNIRVYEHRDTGAVQALAEAGARFTDDGYIPYEDDATSGWTASLHEDRQSVTGVPISPLGYATRNLVRLALNEWQLRLRNGDIVLEMHIPDRDPLTLAHLQDLLAQALDFFPRYHPELPFNAFSCNSWFFNTQLVDWLPPHANLLAFQRQGYLFPVASDGKDGLYFVFGRWNIDLDTAPRDTRLRRAMLDHMAAGHKLRSGGFFLLPEDVSRFGQEPYRTAGKQGNR